MRAKLIALTLAAAAASPAFAADDIAALKAEFARLAERIAALESHNQELEKALSSERLSEQEPELATRLKANEFQTLAMQKQARQVKALEGISVSANLLGTVQQVNDNGAAVDQNSRANYRGDLTVTLPGGEMDGMEGKIFTQLRFGQGNGVGLKPTYTSTPNSGAFQTGAGPDDSFAILAQAWYQLAVPLPRDGIKANSRERLNLTFGKIDPFMFFDQNAAADDESARFMNNVFVHNPLLDSGGDVGADAYGFAPGAILQYVNEQQKGSEWGVSLGVFGAGPAANFNGSVAGRLVIAQAETKAQINYLPGSYRAYVWNNNRSASYDPANTVVQSHSGFGLSVDQRVTDSLTLFTRYGQQMSGQVKFDRAVTLGAELTGNGWSRAADSLGFAIGALRTSADFQNDSLAVTTPSYQADGWEKQAELYYRYKLNSKLEITPDLQLIQRPAGNGDAQTISVIGLRVKLSL